MATTRQSIVRGPGTVKFDNVKLFDANGINAEVESSTQEIPSSIAGNLDTIKTDQIGKITLTPVGEISSALLTLLYPFQTPNPGASIMGSTDKPLVISSRAGTKVTFHNAALSKIPDLILSPVKTAFGSAEFTALLANGKLPTDANSFFKVETAAYADGDPGRTGLSGCHYVGTWGTGNDALSIPDTLDGWTVSFELQLDPVTTDSQGTIDYTFGGLTVRASCTPLGLSEAQILGALPILGGRGTSTATSKDLVIAAPNPGLTVTLKSAALVTGPIAWGATTLRAGQIGFVAHRAVSSGTLGALYSVAQTAAAQG